MCERDTVNEWTAEKGYDWSLNRRHFAALTAAGAVAACTRGAAANAGEGLREDMVSIVTKDGTMDAFFVRPASGSYPAVVTWPDIAGLREAFKVMARRLAGQGYAVLVANPYYRDTKVPQFEDFNAFRSQNGFEKVGPWREKLTADAIGSDAGAMIGWLDKQDSVDSTRGVGTNGYCMGGPFTVFSAAAVPERVRAAASFHGAGLAKEDDPQSPHRLLDKTRASFLFAIAQNDDAKDPEAKVKLRAAAEAAGREAEIEVYPADHGWCVIDSPAYDKAAAEKAWERMSVLFAEALKG
ncbi:dienelactone hydrolase family protein [Stakelama pacifica]|uniref:Carboxymethylenebutenolidase n=1 Tax=Stakelama pacifica TaxID=517720 RepID=A0A4R6FCI2_9SPHN|nr:dienelactone hydrolase family protein [Stakelama pacifica]TDN78812.1 carboxymethylenebutenolidase [Stakelama pacifica]GGO99032.1 hydrolase [Stakelama pacifica]